MPLELTRRSRLILNRWASVTACGMVATCVIALLEGSGVLPLPSVSEWIARLPTVLFVVVLNVLALAAMWPAAQGRWSGFLGTRHFVTYPPIWMAVIVGLLAWSLWSSSDNQTFRTPTTSARLIAIAILLVHFVPALVAVAVLAIGSRNRPTSKSDGAELPAGGNTFASVLDWLRDDSEVLDPGLDRFGGCFIARRMADRLLHHDPPPTMALIGPSGSGKSTVACFVRHYLANTPDADLEFVRISLWPFDSSDAAVHGILQSVVAAVAKRTNVLSVIGVPDAYASAVAGSSSLGATIRESLRREDTPNRIIERLSVIIQAAGFRLVLWMEDLERFSAKGGAADNAAERLAPVRSLLYLLDRSRNISVIVSDTSLQTGFDVEKLARFVEIMPSLDADEVRETIAIVRDACLGGYPVFVIDPASMSALAKGAERNSTVLQLIDELTETNLPSHIAITRLVSTPRILKDALRITVETWTRMPGEIAFDDVLIASVLRVSRRDLFAFIVEKLVHLQHGFRRPVLAANPPLPHPTKARLDALLSDEGAHTYAAARGLLGYLFPKMDGGDENDSAYLSNPQGLCVDRHVNYFHRYMSMSAADDAESDQAALRDIATWKKGGISDLLNRLRDPARADQIETFTRQFTGEELCRLLRELVPLIVDTPTKHIQFGDGPEGLIALWRMMLNRNPRPELVRDVALEVLGHAVPRHLSLGIWIWEYFVERKDRIPSLIKGEDREEMRQRYRDVFLDAFGNPLTADALRAAIAIGPPWALDQTLDFVGRDDAIADSRWNAVVSVILAAAKKDPGVMCPAISYCVTNARDVFVGALDEDGHHVPARGINVEFAEERASKMFGLDQLMPVLSECAVSPNLEHEIKLRCEAAVTSAVEWVAKNHRGRSDAAPSMASEGQVGGATSCD